MSKHSQTDHKNNAFSETTKFEFAGRRIESSSPLIMGILNLTTDSFFEESRVVNEKNILQKAGEMLAQGADIIDIGAISSRPGATFVDEETELDRLVPVIKLLVKQFPEALFSVDTFRVNVAKKVIDAGAFMINDISGGIFDPEMIDFIGTENVPYVMMHMHGKPLNMQVNPLGVENETEIFRFFDNQTKTFLSKGAQQLVIDPGIGFGKTLDLNYKILAGLKEYQRFSFPILIGISRKSLINMVLDTTPAEALNGTTVLNTLALMQGANILRVHDVKEAVEVRKLFEKFVRSER